MGSFSRRYASQLTGDYTSQQWLNYWQLIKTRNNSNKPNSGIMKIHSRSHGYSNKKMVTEYTHWSILHKHDSNRALYGHFSWLSFSIRKGASIFVTLKSLHLFFLFILSDVNQESSAIKLSEAITLFPHMNMWLNDDIFWFPLTTFSFLFSPSIFN